jgi:hypothetical protein
VTFDDHGFARVDGKRFFPIGVWIYGLDPSIMADLHEHRFNTVVGNSIAAGHIKMIEDHGMMMIPVASDEMLKPAKKSPALLAWYLNDEPEEHKVPPEKVKKDYDELKAKDKDHPIGVTHDQMIGPGTYKGSSDFTMTDVYPVTADRKWPMSAVGDLTEQARKANGPNWPNFTFIQTFGGPETDGGIWSQPLPHEVRFMAIAALVHRANGILYFSYWPRSPETWASISELNRDIEQLVPWLIADGDEQPASSSNPAVEIRARKVAGGGWMILAVNTTRQPQQATLKIPSLGDATPRRFRDGEPATWKSGARTERFAALEEKAYLLGETPAASRVSSSQP